MPNLLNHFYEMVPYNLVNLFETQLPLLLLSSAWPTDFNGKTNDLHGEKCPHLPKVFAGNTFLT